MRSFTDLSPMRDEGTIDLAIDPRQSADPLMRREARWLVQQAILSLPPHDRVPIVMKDILQLSLDECAAMDAGRGCDYEGFGRRAVRSPPRRVMQFAARDAIRRA